MKVERRSFLVFLVFAILIIESCDFFESSIILSDPAPRVGQPVDIIFVHSWNKPVAKVSYQITKVSTLDGGGSTQLAYVWDHHDSSDTIVFPLHGSYSVRATMYETVSDVTAGGDDVVTEMFDVPFIDNEAYAALSELFGQWSVEIKDPQKSFSLLELFYFINLRESEYGENDWTLLATLPDSSGEPVIYGQAWYESATEKIEFILNYDSLHYYRFSFITTSDSTGRRVIADEDMSCGFYNTNNTDSFSDDVLEYSEISAAGWWRYDNWFCRGIGPISRRANIIKE